MPLTLKVSEKRPRFFTIELSGSLDTNTHQQLDLKVEQLINDGAARVITLDMAGVDYISSMGVRSVFKAKKGLAAYPTTQTINTQSQRLSRFLSSRERGIVSTSVPAKASTAKRVRPATNHENGAVKVSS